MEGNMKPHHTQTPHVDLDMELDLLVDNELPDDQRKHVLRAIDKQHPDQWRTLALRFLERQAERAAVQNLMGNAPAAPAPVHRLAPAFRPSALRIAAALLLTAGVAASVGHYMGREQAAGPGGPVVAMDTITTSIPSTVLGSDQGQSIEVTVPLVGSLAAPELPAAGDGASDRAVRHVMIVPNGRNEAVVFNVVKDEVIY